MAALLLSAAGSAIGASFGGTFLGLSGAVIGQAIGTVVGTAIDRYLFAPSQNISSEGPRLQELQITSSTEGAPIPRGYGRFRVGGQIIWATRIEEVVVVDKEKVGGKGGSTTVTTTSYEYFANFAVALCEGKIQGIGRVWADGKQLDLTDYTYRLYRGTETQMPDSLLESKDGVGNIPAYRGLAYIVFERMPLVRFGNRVPQLMFEITKPIRREDGNAISDLIKGVNLIPGTTEFGYDPIVVEQVEYEQTQNGTTFLTNITKGWTGSDDPAPVKARRIENRHLNNGGSDWENAMNQMDDNLPNLGTVCLVVTWFGTDLRIGNCEIRPKVENSTKRTLPWEWRVSEQLRTAAQIISQINGSPAFGGTPNDFSVIRAIQDLKARGWKVMFYPFILMDIPAGNTLPNPYSNNAAGIGQAVYPWRGRITCSPAIGYTGTVDKTATAATQVNAFLGSAAPGDFSIVTDSSVVGIGKRLDYSGPAEWSYRRFILHYANICKMAGGVDQFCIGTEMVGATNIRSNATTSFPFVSGLITLAGEVSAILTSSEIGYAADWSEYHSYRTGNEIRYNLDPLWSNADIDFIGIDNYLPLSDWRDGTQHLDYLSGVSSPYDLDYLKANVEGGEYFDWYYASVADRIYQVRTPITDGAYNKPWVYRQKDVKSWWLNSHKDRDSSGVESGTTTSWTPQSKKIIFTEYGCPAIDKATNQPNVFYDPKSSESFVPYFSSGARDDEIQRQYIRAMVEYWSDNTKNPLSTGYSGRMIEVASNNYWSYDARPWPTFPADGSTWADVANWQFGHWISGRVDTVNIPDLLAAIAFDYGVLNYDFSHAYGSCDGYILTSPMSFRSAIEPLASVFNFDIIESGTTVRGVSQREAIPVATLTLDELADRGENEEVITFTLSQETELPGSISIRFIDVFKNYESSAVIAQREVVQTENSPVIDIPMVMDYVRAQQAVDRMLYSTWARKETSDFSVMPNFIALEPGDVVSINANGFVKNVRIEGLSDSAVREVSARSFDLTVFTPIGGANRTNPQSNSLVVSSPILLLMDLPLLDVSLPGYRPYTAAYSSPWVGGVAVYKSITTSNYKLDTTVNNPAFIGATINLSVIGAIHGVWDNGPGIELKLLDGSLESVTDEEVLAGANAIALQNTSGGWEILQFATATLLAPLTYRLTRLLRGQLGTEDQIGQSVPVGSRVVFLNGAIGQLNFNLSDLNKSFNFKYGPVIKDIGDSSYRVVNQTFVGRGLKPYAPTQFHYSINAGDVLLSWIRRTRIGGDDWELPDPPLNEETEKYEIDIIQSPSTVVRTITVTSATNVVYTAAQQTSDGITTPFEAEVFQISATVGRGIGRRIQIT